MGRIKKLNRAEPVLEAPEVLCRNFPSWPYWGVYWHCIDFVPLFFRNVQTFTVTLKVNKLTMGFLSVQNMETSTHFLFIVWCQWTPTHLNCRCLLSSSESVKQRTNIFYLLPERSCVPNSPLWFSSTPLDDATLETMLIRILTVRELHLKSRIAGGRKAQVPGDLTLSPGEEGEDDTDEDSEW